MKLKFYPVSCAADCHAGGGLNDLKANDRSTILKVGNFPRIP